MRPSSKHRTYYRFLFRVCVYSLLIYLFRSGFLSGIAAHIALRYLVVEFPLNVSTHPKWLTAFRFRVQRTDFNEMISTNQTQSLVITRSWRHFTLYRSLRFQLRECANVKVLKREKKQKSCVVCDVCSFITFCQCKQLLLLFHKYNLNQFESRSTCSRFVSVVRDFGLILWTLSFFQFGRAKCSHSVLDNLHEFFCRINNLHCARGQVTAKWTQ